MRAVWARLVGQRGDDREVVGGALLGLLVERMGTTTGEATLAA
jgi:hypothetical protein